MFLSEMRSGTLFLYRTPWTHPLAPKVCVKLDTDSVLIRWRGENVSLAAAVIDTGEVLTWTEHSDPDLEVLDAYKLIEAAKAT